MSFDKAKRKLITGSDKGEVKVWNPSSGAVLTRLKRHTQQEITAIAHSCGALLKNILVAGWDRDITYFQDDGSKEILPGRYGVFTPQCTLGPLRPSLGSRGSP